MMDLLPIFIVSSFFVSIIIILILVYNWSKKDKIRQKAVVSRASPSAPSRPQPLLSPNPPSQVSIPSKPTPRSAVQNTEINPNWPSCDLCGKKVRVRQQIRLEDDYFIRVCDSCQHLPKKAMRKRYPKPSSSRLSSPISHHCEYCASTPPDKLIQCEICGINHICCPACWQDHIESHRKAWELLQEDPDWFERNYGSSRSFWVYKEYFDHGLEIDRIIPHTDDSLKKNKDFFDPYTKK